MSFFSLAQPILSAMDFELPPEEMMPETAKYTLRALVLQGSDIPLFKFPNAQVPNDSEGCSTRLTICHKTNGTGRRSEYGLKMGPIGI